MVCEIVRNTLWIFCAFLSACTPSDTSLHFNSEGKNLILSGIIDGSTPERFKEAMILNPLTEMLVLKNIAGSINDEANYEFGRAVNISKLNTHIPAKGMVASGGTDLFMAGIERTIEDGACVGVHSWSWTHKSAEDRDGSNLSRTNLAHDKFLKYFDEIGVDRSFYWFTLEAAGAKSMYWMTVADIKKYKITTQSVNNLSQSVDCKNR